MARVCTVCAHPDRPAIDQAMVNRRPFRRLAEQFGLGKDSLLRHHDEHLPATLVKAAEAEDVANADDLLTRITAWRERTDKILTKAEAGNDFRGCAALMREIRGWETLLAEVEQRIDRRPTVNVLMSAEWLQVRQIVFDVLADDPARRALLSARLLALEAPA